MLPNRVRLLLLLASVCTVWEALAKSVPDQGAFGKLNSRGMQHNEEMGVVAFLWLLSASAALWSPSRWEEEEAFLFI